MKQKVDFLKPLWWFCLLPIYFILANIISSLLWHFFSPLMRGITNGSRFDSGVLAGAICKIILSVSVFLLYKKNLKLSQAKQTFKKNNVYLFLICLCIMVIYHGIRWLFIEYSPNPKDEIIGALNYLRFNFKYISEQTVFYPVKYISWFSKFFVFAIVFSGPIFEELLFRRVIYDSMKKQSHSVAVAVVLSGFLFSLFHFYNPSFFSGFTTRFILGMGLAYCYEKTSNLLYPILLHSIWNAMAVVLPILLWPFSVLFGLFLVLISLIIIFVLGVIFLITKVRGKINVKAAQLEAASVIATMRDGVSE